MSNILKTLLPTRITVETTASKFAALGSEQRLQVLGVLVGAGHNGLSIGELG